MNVLDGLLYHESELRIEENYTDTKGFTDHLLAIFPAVGCCLAPRIRVLKEKKRNVSNDATLDPVLKDLLGVKHHQHLDRLASMGRLNLSTSLPASHPLHSR